MMEYVKKQNETANLEIADLKRKLETNVEEKKAEHQETLKKLKEWEEIFEAESDLNQKLEDVEKKRERWIGSRYGRKQPIEKCKYWNWWINIVDALLWI